MEGYFPIRDNHFVAFFALVVLFVLLGFGEAKEANEASDLDFRIYNAVLSDVEPPKKDLRGLILDSTLNLNCGESSRNPILVNDCSPMVLPPHTRQDIFQLLRENWKQMKKSAWENLEARNAESIRLGDGFNTPWKHRLEGKDVPPDNSSEWDSADCAFYFSTPGFSSDSKQAIVFVFFASYMDGVASRGDYFLVQLGQKGWVVNDRVEYFVSDGN
jgi:hypothetical protein